MEKNLKLEKKKLAWYQKNYLADYKRQFKIILILAGVTFFFTLAMFLMTYTWILRLRPIFTQTMVGPIKPEEAFKIIADLLLYRLFGIMALMYMFFVLAGIILTHRLTGPIWKLQRDLVKFFDEKEIEPIGFRGNDEFQELPNLINKLIKGYRPPRE